MNYRDAMMRALEGALDAEAQRRLEAALENDARLRAEWRQLRELQRRLRAGRALAFKPFFAARLMRRLGQRESLVDGLLWFFRPLAPALVAAVLLLALGNWREREVLGADASVLEAVFAVAPVTLEAAYAME